jgi:hypothetical protein
MKPNEGVEHMARLQRGAPLAIFAALALFSWGCGSSKSAAHQDGGQDAHVQVQQDAAVQEDTLPSQDDANPSVCNPNGGKDSLGLCNVEGDCKCPFACGHLNAEKPGGCYPECDKAADPTTQCTDDSICWGIEDDATGRGYCFPVGDLTVNFENQPWFDNNDDNAAFSETVTNTSLVAGSINATAAIMKYGLVIHSVEDSGWLFIVAGPTSSTKQYYLQLFIHDSLFVQGANLKIEDADSDLLQVVMFDLTYSGKKKVSEVFLGTVVAGEIAITQTPVDLDAGMPNPDSGVLPVIPDSGIPDGGLPNQGFPATVTLSLTNGAFVETVVENCGKIGTDNACQ